MICLYYNQHIEPIIPIHIILVGYWNLHNMGIHMYQVSLIFFGLFAYSFCLNPQKLKSPENYGPYVMDWQSAELCKGPKAVNVAQVTFNFNKESGLFTFNYTFKIDTRIDEIKVSVSTEKNGAKTTMWNYRIKDPCRNFIVGSLVRLYFKTDNNCVTKKGFYLCQLNFHETGKLFLGDSFFYGQFIFKSIIMSKAGRNQ
ncbi:uncharacterized protein LOC119190427 [Manduca sexta]|uniref:uncharacterized protein LOC119190427 n=1 Tax=Manduca sexta TaxID=7130 RepID=UPI00188EDD8C|nr:uncharacterized protein LOC119190427 [Manduca sexta]